MVDISFMDKNTSKPNETDIWNEGRRELQVTLQDGSTETVVIGKVPMRRMQQLSSSIKKEDEQVYLFVRKRLNGEEVTLEWVDTLEEEAFLDILERGWELTGPLFERWFKVQKKRLSHMGIDFDKDLKAAEKTLEEVKSKTPPAGKTASAAS